MTTKAKIWLGCGIALALLFVADFFDHEHHHEWWDTLQGFDIAYGFIGCLVIVYVSKWLGKAALQRPEDHYDA